MAIATPTLTNFATASISGTTDTHSHTMGSGTNYGVLISIFCNQYSSGLTWNGTACTLVKQYTGANSNKIQLYRLENPTSGTHNFVASGLTAGGGIWYEIVEFTGVNQTSVTRDASAVSPEISGSTTYSQTLTVNGSDSWIFSSVRNDGAFGVTASTGLTRRWDEQSATQHGGGDSNGIVSSGSNTVSWTVGSTVATYGIAVELQAAGGGSTVNSNFFALM